MREGVPQGPVSLEVRHVDFPLFHGDFFGNRMLIAVIAILHVLINHALAVGAMPLVTLLEWRGYRRQEPAWDELAYRILFVCFLVTTSVGALTGVGIWLSASLVNPAAIGSLLRVFFLAWFSEWIVFVIEVALILFYFLTWKKWTPEHKGRHIAVGAALSLFSWFTMGIIVAILGFMMQSGNWVQQPSLLSGVMNPIYLPQLAFRTPLAILLAGMFVLLLIPFFTERSDPFRARAVRLVSLWMLAWLPFCLAGGVWYWEVVPPAMAQNVSVALMTQAFAEWHQAGLELFAVAGLAVVAVTLWGVLAPRFLPRAVLVLPFLLAIVFVGYFERVREFIRKPHVIQGYMYANGIRIQDYPLLQNQGLLKYATYAKSRTISDANRLDAGRDVFLLACSRCHTTRGVNSVVVKLEKLFGAGPSPWNAADVKNYINSMHQVRPFMPPFPGNRDELEALSAYLCWLKENRVPLEGAQEAGVVVPTP